MVAVRKQKNQQKYFSHDEIQEMTKARNIIYKARNRIYSMYGIDLLDTDNLSNLDLYEVIHQYDPDYNVNFARNGEDATSKNTFIEQKNAKI